MDPALVNSAGQLIRSGFDPDDVMRQLGLPPINHTGAVPVSIREPAEEA